MRRREREDTRREREVRDEKEGESNNLREGREKAKSMDRIEGIEEERKVC